MQEELQLKRSYYFNGKDFGDFMDQKELGKTGEKIPAMGMGSWELSKGAAESVAALKHGLDLGIRFIDTAEMYGTEGVVGEAIRDEKEVFIATKVWPDHFGHDEVIKACNDSLKRLGIKTIDLYQLHWPNYNISIKETMSAMEELQKQGKIRHIGVSNFSIQEFETAQSVLKNSEIVSNQIEYSPIVREFENEFVDYARKNRVTVIAYSPLGHGALFKAENREFMNLLNEIGGKYGKSAVQVALRWVISKDRVVAIPKANRIEHVDENFGALEFKLDKEDIGKIDDKSRAFQQPPIAFRIKQRDFGRELKV